jgi:hypothetical protein
MSDVLKRVLVEAIAVREEELEELRRQLRDTERGENLGPKTKRRRKATGLKAGSVPFIIADIIRDKGGLSSAAISDALKQHGKIVQSRTVAAALNRYVEAGRIFDRTPDGLYTLRSDAA